MFKTFIIILLLGILIELIVVNHNLTFLHKQMESIIDYIENVESALYQEDGNHEYHI